MVEPDRKIGQINPFNTTKASHLSDQEIEDYWVDIASDDGYGFLEMAKPTSAMPMLILGGKGSGKTHLMRYMSYALQKIRYEQDIISGIKQEQYVGVYFKCSGLNAARFTGKGINEEIWGDIFAFFMELWLAQIVIEIIIDAFSEREEFIQNEADICNDIFDLFDSPDFDRPSNLFTLTRTLNDLQKRVNTSVNNSSLTRSVDVKILVTAGKLTFGIPQIIVSRLASLKAVQVLYLVDEFENLAEPQQKYINTLLREKEGPCSFKVGSRLYGVKTFGTFSANEENKEGSEYEVVYLDANLRKTKKSYSTFAQRLCERRLAEAGYSTFDLKECFKVIPSSKCMEELAAYITSDKQDDRRPYFDTLRKNLEQGLRSNAAIGVRTSDDIDRIIKDLQVPTYTFLEKVNTFLLYQDWYSGENLVEAAAKISEECSHFIQEQKSTRLEQVLSHFKEDLLAQLIREYQHKQLYLGFDTFIDMSDGLPRNLLIILKHIFRWSSFNGEQPFQRGCNISVESQQKGIRDASEWFYNDARLTGPDSETIKSSINRLATFFRDVRFSDKPSECSISSFSADISQSSQRARQTIDQAEKWSLLINIEGGQKNRNSQRVDPKYQINSMLAPRYDLPVSRRGAIALNWEEINAIFDPNYVSEYESLMRERIERMTAPLFGKNMQPRGPMLPGFEND
ncbi:MAG TPA: hypothetical protein VGC87_02270 [Pyrinomonadaceae bacterium]|jgi:hypothetical protein